MKHLLFILLIFCFQSMLSAQSSIIVPSLQGSDVVVEVYDCFAGSYISISDGIIDTYKYKIPVKPKEIDFPKTMSNTFTQLRNQGYKLLTSTSVSNGNSSCGKNYYIFEKK